MPTSGAPPPLASSIPYSPCQLSVAPSLTIKSGLRSSTGNKPCGRLDPASSVSAHALEATQSASGAVRARNDRAAARRPSPQCCSSDRRTRVAPLGLRFSCKHNPMTHAVARPAAIRLPLADRGWTGLQRASVVTVTEADVSGCPPPSDATASVMLPALAVDWRIARALPLKAAILVPL